MVNGDFSKEAKFIKNLFNSISNNYDKLNDIMSFGLHRRIKKDVIEQTLLNPSPLVGEGRISKRGTSFRNSGEGYSLLDLCTGTGDLAVILKEKYPEAKVIGVDFSPQMLEIARQKHTNKYPPLAGGSKSSISGRGINTSQDTNEPYIEFLEADCTNLPFEDESFDLCVISFGLRNIEDMGKAIAEIHRVLRPYGLFINIDLGKPNKFFNLFLKPYMYLWVALLGKIFHGDETPYKYLAASNETFPAPAELIKIYEQIGFTNIKNKNYLFGQIAAQVSIK